MEVPIDPAMVDQMGSLCSFLVKVGLASTSDHSPVVAITLFVTLLCACIVIGHLLEENRWMNEAITAVILGLCTGVIVLLISQGTRSHILLFSEELFFIYLLPPIIFNAGELELERHGLKLLARNTSSFTPTSDGRYLHLGPDASFNHTEISKFSHRDAMTYPRS